MQQNNFVCRSNGRVYFCWFPWDGTNSITKDIPAVDYSSATGTEYGAGSFRILSANRT
jgi:hypothetical protein